MTNTTLNYTLPDVIFGNATDHLNLLWGQRNRWFRMPKLRPRSWTSFRISPFMKVAGALTRANKLKITLFQMMEKNKRKNPYRLVATKPRVVVCSRQEVRRFLLSLILFNVEMRRRYTLNDSLTLDTGGKTNDPSTAYVKTRIQTGIADLATFSFYLLILTSRELDETIIYLNNNALNNYCQHLWCNIQKNASVNFTWRRQVTIFRNKGIRDLQNMMAYNLWFHS